MARCIASGISTSLISTVETLMPHGSVCSSMIFWRSSFRRSRSDSSSSRSARPSTERSVVWAICEVAGANASISVTEAAGSTVRK
jgi:hypothetical protein